jgi:heme/copper-type cytochrome/quinol oxidase subunit 4
MKGMLVFVFFLCIVAIVVLGLLWIAERADNFWED